MADIIVVGTGHRPEKLGGYSTDAGNKVKAIISSWLNINKPKKVIAGCALGFDQELMKASIDLDIPIIAAIPFRGQENNWPTESRVIYKILLEKCESIVVSEGPYAAHKMQKRNEWMIKRAVSDKSKPILLTMFDGSDGGTANCIKYAQNYPNLKIVNLYEQWANTRDYER